MSRYQGATVALEWESVSIERPCPVCGEGAACSILEDGTFARCVNVVCDRPILTGGWLHRLADLDEPALQPI
jgi:hypothetical protein